MNNLRHRLCQFTLVMLPVGVLVLIWVLWGELVVTI